MSDHLDFELSKVRQPRRELWQIWHGAGSPGRRQLMTKPLRSRAIEHGELQPNRTTFAAEVRQQVVASRMCLSPPPARDRLCDTGFSIVSTLRCPAAADLQAVCRVSLIEFRGATVEVSGRDSDFNRTAAWSCLLRIFCGLQSHRGHLKVCTCTACLLWDSCKMLRPEPMWQIVALQHLCAVITGTGGAVGPIPVCLCEPTRFPQPKNFVDRWEDECDICCRSNSERAQFLSKAQVVVWAPWLSPLQDGSWCYVAAM